MYFAQVRVHRNCRPNFGAAFCLVAFAFACAPGESKAGLGPNESSPITALVLTPSSVSMHTDETQSFAASGLRGDGSTTIPSVHWAATGGVISVGGLYTPGQTPGNFSVSATLDGDTISAVAAVTVSAPASPIVGITLTPSSTSLYSDESIDFNVTAIRQDGTTTTPNVTWSATGGSISPSGVYTAGSVTGTFSVIAAVAGAGLLDTATVAILAQPAPGSCSHQPASYSRIQTEFDFGSAVPSGGGTERAISGSDWSVIYDGDGGGGSNFSKVSDSTAPFSPNGVWQLRQAAGTYSTGHGYGNVFSYLPPNTRKLYACFYLKLSSGYYIHPISHKFFEVFTSGGGDVMVQLGRAGNYYEGYDQTTDYVFPTLVNKRPVTNRWVLHEIQVESGNPGVIRVWIDGELRTQVITHSVAPGEPNFETVGLYGHMGGGGYTMAADQYQWIDHILIATP